MTKQCELCDLPARMYCESDQASLCWECDAKVHGANFLVARHTRSLLCRSCQAPTPWRASGPRLGPTVSVCNRCLGTGACDVDEGEFGGGGAVVGGGGGRVEGEAEGVVDLGVDDDDDDDENDENGDGDDDEEDEDGDNQVVPWSLEAEATAATPPPVASCSSSEECSSDRTAICQGSPNGVWENANLLSSHWQAESSPSQPGYHHPFSRPSAAAAANSGRMLKEYEDDSRSFGGPLRTLPDRKRAAAPPPAPISPSGRPRLDHMQRGASGTVDILLPSSPSPPI